MDTKSIEFGRWLEQADREELIDFIQKNAGSFDVNTVLGIDDRGLRPDDVFFAPKTNDPRDCNILRKDLDWTYIFNEKVESIKALRFRLGIGLKTAKDAVEAYEAAYYPRAIARDNARKGVSIPVYIKDEFTLEELQEAINESLD